MKTKFIKLSGKTFFRLKEEDMEKGKPAIIGDVATWGDGKQYRKVSDKNWELVGDGHKGHGDTPHPSSKKEESGGDVKTPSQLHEKFRVAMEKMSDEHRAVFRGGKMDFEKRTFTAPNGKIALHYKDGKVVAGKIGGMEKAKMHKYIRRVAKPTGKGFYYFYTHQQFKEYQEKGTIPEQKTESVWSKVLSFFGVKSEEEAKSKVEAMYESHKGSLSGVSKPVFADHVTEYVNNKEKWDKRLSQKSVVTKDKESGEVKKQSTDSKKTAIAGAGQKYNLSLMKQIAGMLGEAKGQSKTSNKDYEKILTPEVVAELKRNVVAAKAEGNDSVNINTDRILSLYTDKLTPEESKSFDWDSAEKFILDRADKMLGEIKSESTATVKKIPDEELKSYIDIEKRYHKAADEMYALQDESDSKEYKRLEAFAEGLDEQLKKHVSFNANAHHMSKEDYIAQINDYSERQSIKSGASEPIESASELKNMPSDADLKKFKGMEFSAADFKYSFGEDATKILNSLVRDGKVSVIKKPKGDVYKINDSPDNFETMPEAEYKKLSDTLKAAKGNSNRVISDVLKGYNNKLSFSQSLKNLGMWTDSRMLVTDKTFSDKIYAKMEAHKSLSDDETTLRTAENVDRIVPKTFDEKPLKIIGVIGEKKKKILLESSSGDKIALNPDFVEFFRKEYGNKMTIHPSAGSESPVVVLSEGKTVGVIMPFHVADLNTDKVKTAEDVKKEKEKEAETKKYNDAMADKIKAESNGPLKAEAMKDFKANYQYNGSNIPEVNDTVNKMLENVIDKTKEIDFERAKTQGTSLKEVLKEKQRILAQTVERTAMDINQKKTVKLKADLHPRNENLRELFHKMTGIKLSKKTQEYNDQIDKWGEETKATSSTAEAAETSSFDKIPSPMDRGRIEKSLKQLYRNNGVTKTLKQMIDDGDIVSKKEVTEPAVRWNRIKFNRMGYDEQAKYEARMKETKKNYRFLLADGSGYDVPKLVYDHVKLKNESMAKASALLLDALAKAKKEPIGTEKTYSNGEKYKKKAEGKWVKVSEGKKGADKEEDKGKKKVELTDKNKKKDIDPQHKATIRDTLKRVASVLAEALAGKNPNAQAADTIEKTGEDAKNHKTVKPKKQIDNGKDKTEKPTEPGKEKK